MLKLLHDHQACTGSCSVIYIKITLHACVSFPLSHFTAWWLDSLVPRLTLAAADGLHHRYARNGTLYYTVSDYAFGSGYEISGLISTIVHRVLSDRISRVTLPPSWVPIKFDGSPVVFCIKDDSAKESCAMSMVIGSHAHAHTTHTHNCSLLREISKLNSISRFDHITFCACNSA